MGKQSWSLRLEQMAAKKRRASDSSMLRNHGSKRVLPEGPKRISTARTIVGLIGQEVLPLAWFLRCGRGLTTAAQPPE